MNRIWDIVSRIICLFLSIGLFFVIVIYLGLVVSNKVITKENISEVIQTQEMVNFLGTSESTFMTNLYDIAEDSGITPELMDNIVNSQEFKVLIGDYIGEVVDKVLYNGEVNNITSSQIVDVVNKVMDRSSNNLGYSLTIEQKNIILDEVSAKAPEIIEMLPNYEQLTNGLNNQNIKAIQSLFGSESKIILITIIVVIIGIMALLRWSIYRFAIWSGTTTIVAGGLFAFIGLILQNYSTYEISSTFNQLLQESIFSVFTNIGITTIIIGIVQIVYYIIMKKSLSQHA